MHSGMIIAEVVISEKPKLGGFAYLNQALSAYFCEMRIFYTLVLFFSLFSYYGYSQSTRHALGIYAGAFDFYGPQTGSYLFSEHKKSGRKVNGLLWDPAVKLSFSERVSTWFEAGISAAVSSLHYPAIANDSVYLNTKQGAITRNQEYPMAALFLNIRMNLFDRDKYIFSPYLHTGFGGLSHNRTLDLHLPLGLGINVKLTPNLCLNLETGYQYNLSIPKVNSLFHQLGLVYMWPSLVHKKKTKTPPPVIVYSPKIVVNEDQDNDGVSDIEDKCPSLPGKKVNQGCPDSDGDGFADHLDKCPQDAGLVRLQGCPIPDRDNDGFNDEVDECPDEAFEDNKGCPYVKKEVRQKVDLAAKGVYFKTNSAVLDSSSFQNLDEIINIMKSQEAFIIDIEGHTDNKGNPDKNLVLSQKRADACKAYFIQNGVREGRIESIGYGDLNPIADNATEEGRALNRRTEFKLKWTE
jgi:OOP family OmpA-OmpF porin